jgi:hypothetical protein
MSLKKKNQNNEDGDRQNCSKKKRACDLQTVKPISLEMPCQTWLLILL